MSGITLNAAMRANLLSLQQTSNLQARTQERLATGKKVNSALDNPTSFFAAQSLTNTANDLSNLLDGMGQAIQSITAATQGITAAESIITQMQSVAQSAAQSLNSSSAGNSGGNVQAYTAQGTYKSGSASAVTSTSAYSQNMTNLTASAGTSLNILNGDTMTVEVGSGSTYTFTVGASNANNTTVGNGGGSTIADLRTWMKTVTSGTVTYSTTGNVKLTGASGNLTVSGTLATDLGLSASGSASSVSGSVAAYTATYTNLSAATGSTTLADLTNSAGHVFTGSTTTSGTASGNTGVGSYLTVQVGGGTSQSINVTAGMTVQNLMNDINSISGLTATLDSSGNLKIVNSNSTSVTLGGTADGLLGASTTTGSTTIGANSSETTKLFAGYGAVNSGNLTSTNLVNLQAPSGSSRLISGDQLSVTVGGVTTSITIDKSGSSATTAATVSNLLSSLGQISGITASFNSTTGQLSITAGSQAVTLGGTAAAKLGLPSSIAANQSSTAQGLASYATQYDNLRTQLNQLVQDTSYQGVNLIDGTANSLTVQFNNAANNPNSLTIQGVDLTTTGLGLSAATGNWSSATSVSDAQSALTSAVSTLRANSSSLGQNLTTVQTRQDFTTNLINTLQTGAGDLTNADMNTESANMLALQTQQQLGISSLSLASQAAQGVLKLFP